MNSNQELPILLPRKLIFDIATGTEFEDMRYVISKPKLMSLPNKAVRRLMQQEKRMLDRVREDKDHLALENQPKALN